MLKYIPSLPFHKGFSHELMLNFINFFFCIMWFLSFLLLIYHIDLCMLNHSCNCGMTPTW